MKGRKSSEPSHPPNEHARVEVAEVQPPQDPFSSAELSTKPAKIGPSDRPVVVPAHPHLQSNEGHFAQTSPMDTAAATASQNRHSSSSGASETDHQSPPP
eukprot:CAMPEP_0197454998 /NCGR_PEP_ID=MMETSP1175-20131217/39584_1 /TAXON_ID=1003142 /ORGANISM="Triceratium dubium, Strain CCMP147" /LENGTH=99 /DNA_ID=CAMNT_0042988731 /DNA_START=5 /DNA_END=301 /DNA_ORIENTATION=-